MKSKAASYPYLIWMAIFIIVPLAMIVYFAFTNSDGQFTVENLVGLEKYAPVLLRSLKLAAISTVICLIVSYPIALILMNSKANSQKMMLMLVMLPMWMNFLLRTYAWMTLLEKNGLINRFLGMFGIGPFEMINTEGAVVLGMVYNYLPFMILPLYDKD